MRSLLLGVLCLAVVGGIIAAVFMNLETEPSGRDEPPAVILRAPDGFDVTRAGAMPFGEAALSLRDAPGERVGIEFFENGDTVILLADRGGRRITEMRSAQAGTIVERTWTGDVGRRLEWAVDNGNLDAPGLPPATGKNLYH